MHFVILSSGAYSDYSPEYFVGEYPLTQEEFDKKGRDLGDEIIAEFEALPEREHKCDTWCWHQVTGKVELEKYNPVTGKRCYHPDGTEWETRMKEWLTSLGFQPLPDEIPEINIEYGDVPHN